MNVVKKVSAIAFAISFLMAIILFTQYGSSIIPIRTARMIFIGTGGVALFLNLITFQTGKFHPVYNFTYWIGAIILFVGLIFMIMKWKYNVYIILAGIVVLGVSFFLPKELDDSKPEDSDILDDQL